MVVGALQKGDQDRSRIESPGMFPCIFRSFCLPFESSKDMSHCFCCFCVVVWKVSPDDSGQCSLKSAAEAMVCWEERS